MDRGAWWVIQSMMLPNGRIRLSTHMHAHTPSVYPERASAYTWETPEVVPQQLSAAKPINNSWEIKIEPR